MSNIYQFSDITQFLQNGDTSSKVVDINSFFQNKQVVGGSSTDILNANLYNYNYVKGHGNIIEFPNINNNLNGGIKRAPIVNNVEEVNKAEGTVKYSANKYSTTSIPFSTVVQNTLAGFGMSILAEQQNFIISEAWNAIAVDTFGIGDRISEDDVANGYFQKHIQAFCDKNGITYLPYTIYDKVLDFLIDKGYFTEGHTDPFNEESIGSSLSISAGQYSDYNAAFNMALSVIPAQYVGDASHAVNLFKAHAYNILNPLTPFDFYNVEIWYSSPYDIRVYVYGHYVGHTSPYPIRKTDVDGKIVPYFSYVNKRGSTGYYIRVREGVLIEQGDSSIITGTAVSTILAPYSQSDIAYATSIGNQVPSSLNTDFLQKLVGGKLLEVKTDIPTEFPDFWNSRDEIGTINPAWIDNPEAPDINPISPLVIIPSPSMFPTQYPLEMPITDPDFQKTVQGGDNPNDDGKNNETYQPIITPQFAPITVPVTTPIEVGGTGTDPVYITNSPNPIIPSDGQDSGNDDNTTPDDDTPTPTPIPPIVDIGGSASALYTVYNPSKNNLNALGSYLWTSDILEQLVRIFTNNPMDAIISLHSIYCSPSLGANSNIKLGYLDAGSGTNCPTVNSQFVSIDCGYVDIPEYYGDCRDYSPYTNVTIFLPFIGFRTVKTEDIVAGRVNIKYNIDVLTGSCVAIVSVRKKGVSYTLYTFEGNCSMSLPLTGADHTRMIAGLSSAVLGGVTGGVAGAVMGGVNAMASGSFQANIQRSGSFSGNAGAMSIKKPYIIVNRDYIYDAESYNELYGFPANISTRLGDCSGYNRVKSVHVDSISNATKEEKDEIESILRSGFIL